MGRPKGSTNKKKVEDIKEVKETKKVDEKVEVKDDMAKNIADNIKEEKEEVVVESISETVEKEVKKAKTTGVKKYERKTFDDEDLVPVASFASGQTNLRNTEKPFDITTWEKFGDVQEVRYGTLMGLKRKRSKAFESMLYVLDEDVIKELGLAPIYAKIGRLEDIIKILDKSTDEAITYIRSASKEVKEVLRQILSNKLERKEDINFFKVKALAEELDMELNLDI